MTATIRRAAPADLDALVALFRCFANEQARMDARLAYADDAEVRYRNTLRAALRSHTYAVFVAVVDEKIVGYQSAEHWYEAPLYAAGREVYLHELYVEPGHRGQGLGRKLGEAAVQWAEEEGAVRLRFSILSCNVASRALWESLGAAPLSATYTLELEARPPADAVPRKLGF